MSQQRSNKDCQEFAELISAYFDGRLPESQAKLVAQHLASCEGCNSRLEDYKRFRALINADTKACPIDLESAVMANLEREQLLDGLELMAKPPVSRGVKWGRAISVAALLALIAGTAVMVMHFKTDDLRSPTVGLRNEDTLALNLDQETKAKTNSRGAVESAAELSRSYEQNEQSVEVFNRTKETIVEPSDLTAKIIAQSKADLPATVSADDSMADNLGITNESEVEDEIEVSVNSAPSPTNSHASSWDLTEDWIEPNQPISLTPATLPSVMLFEQGQLDEQNASADLAWPLPLTQRLFATDMPMRMLLKEQALIIMEEHEIPVLYEHFQVSQALYNQSEFYYVAKKGLDLPPGSTSSQILLCTTPAKIAEIYPLFQFLMSDEIGFRSLKDLETLVSLKIASASLVKKIDQSLDILSAAFGLDQTFTSLTLPTTQPILAMNPLTLSTSTKPLTTRPSSPATQSTKPSQAKFMSDIKLVPILIAIDIKVDLPDAPDSSASPTTRPSTRPTTTQSN